mmetsp:Transcript_51177/g.115028  ORF Transcript_51177/g.115028 Transcript_51177/m.115028 type:complete len:274 (+) Transcript_51177:850-1671(+)
MALERRDNISRTPLFPNNCTAALATQSPEPHPSTMRKRRAYTPHSPRTRPTPHSPHGTHMASPCMPTPCAHRIFHLAQTARIKPRGSMRDGHRVTRGASTRKDKRSLPQLRVVRTNRVSHWRPCTLWLHPVDSGHECARPMCGYTAPTRRAAWPPTPRKRPTPTRLHPVAASRCCGMPLNGLERGTTHKRLSHGPRQQIMHPPHREQALRSRPNPPRREAVEAIEASLADPLVRKSEDEAGMRALHEPHPDTPPTTGGAAAGQRSGSERARTS